MPVLYIDVDGTLTDKPDGPWGEPREDIIETVRSAIAAGHQVIIWSAQGEDYARAFAAMHHLHAYAYLSKPDLCVDDRNPIRPPHKMQVIPPEQLKDYLVAKAT